MGINQHVWKLIYHDPSLTKNLKLKLTNHRALANYLIKTHKLTATLDAVISAIRRIDLDDVPLLSHKIEDVFKGVAIITKTQMASMTLKEVSYKNIVEDYIHHAILRKNYRLLKSKNYLKLILEQKDIDKKIKVFPHNEIIAINKDLGEIRLTFTKDITKMKGVLARITGELALNNVNVEEIVICIPEILIYVKENELLTAHQSLLGLTRVEQN